MGEAGVPEVRITAALGGAGHQVRGRSEATIAVAPNIVACRPIASATGPTSA